jgi:hypothetical protein
MSIVLTILDHQAEPVPGDQAAVLSMSFAPGKGYRFKAIAHPSQRELGRWVSDCPLAAYESAMLWLARFQWSVQQTPEIQQMLSEVMGMAPLNPQVHPLQAIAILSRNLQAPGSPDIPGDILVGFGSDGNRQLPGPRPQQGRPDPRQIPMNDPYAQAAQQSQAPPRMSSPSPQAPGMSAPTQNHPSQDQGIGEDEREIATFLREAVMALKDGRNAEEVVPVVRQFFGMDEGEPAPVDEEFEAEMAALLADDEFDNDFEDGDFPEDEFNDADFDDGDADFDDGDDNELEGEEGSEQVSYRPVGATEVPEGMDPEAQAKMLGMTDIAAMEKMKRTREKQDKHLAHVYQVVEANERAEEARQAAAEARAQLKRNKPAKAKAKAPVRNAEIPTNGGGHPSPIPESVEEVIREPEPEALKATPPAQASAKKRRPATRTKPASDAPKRRVPAKRKKRTPAKAADA